MSHHFTSLNLRRHGDSQEVVQWAFMAIAAFFWSATVFKPGPVMRWETYGEWVVQFPTQLWAGSLMAASTFYLLGIVINGRWKWSPILRLIGAGWHFLTLSIFSVGAASAPFGENLCISAAVFAVVHFRFAVWNACDLVAAWRTK